MDDYEKKVKKLQAEAMAALQRDMAEAKAKRAADPFRAERQMFLVALVKARLRSGLSQAGLAARLGTSQPAIARIESGRGNPGLNRLLAIAEALGADLMLEYKHGTNPNHRQARRRPARTHRPNYHPS